MCRDSRSVPETCRETRLVLLDEEEEGNAGGDNSENAAPGREAGVEGTGLHAL